MRACGVGMQLAAAQPLGGDSPWQRFCAIVLAECSPNAHQVSSWFGTDDRAGKREWKMVDWPKPYPVRCAMRNAAPGGSIPRRVGQIAALSRREPGAARALERDRCTVGALRGRRLGRHDRVPDAVLNLDEHWDGSGGALASAGTDIPLLARIANLAQQVEIAWNRAGAAGAGDIVRARRGQWFDLERADAMRALLHQPNFFGRRDAIREPHGRAAVAPTDPASGALTLEGGLVPMAEVFGEMVNKQWPWAVHRSKRTALHAGRLAERLGSEPGLVQDTLLAGLCHDLDKLGASNLILDQPGRLSPPERLDGSGWHRGLASGAIPRIGTAVAALGALVRGGVLPVGHPARGVAGVLA